MPGSCCLPSLVALFPQSVRARHTFVFTCLATCLYTKVFYIGTAQPLKAGGKRASRCLHSEPPQTGSNVKKTPVRTHQPRFQRCTPFSGGYKIPLPLHIVGHEYHPNQLASSIKAPRERSLPYGFPLPPGVYSAQIRCVKLLNMTIIRQHRKRVLSYVDKGH